MFRSSLSKIALALAFLFTVSSFIFYIILSSYYEKEAFKRIRLALDYNKAIQEYVSNYQKPTIYALMKEGTLPNDFFDPTLLSSTFIVQHINEVYLQKLQRSNAALHVDFKFASDNPTNITNKATPFESKVLRQFNETNITSFTQHISLNGKDHLFYALPVEANTNKCMRCHSDPNIAPRQMVTLYGSSNGFNEKIGEIRAIISLYTPVDEDNQNMWFFFLSVEFLMLISFLIIYSIIYYYSRAIKQKDKLITKQSKFAAMGEMIGMIAHQWRQPLTGMGMTVDNLKLDIELQTIDEEKWMQNLEQVTTQIHYLSHTIDDFRNFFKPNQEPVEVDVSKLMDESLQIINSTLVSNNITIIKNYNDQAIIVSFRNDLMQVFLNIIKNAKDAYVENSIDNRPLRIITSANSKYCTIIVEDEAGGISDDIMERIFDPYFSTKDEKNGTGLGLYMSKMIVEDHLNGQLEVHSKARATHFKITLPKTLKMEKHHGN